MFNAEGFLRLFGRMPGPSPVTATLSLKGKGDGFLPLFLARGTDEGQSVRTVIHHHAAQTGNLLQLAKRPFQFVFRGIRANKNAGNFTLHWR